jgi:hypothetical protein
MGRRLPEQAKRDGMALSTDCLIPETRRKLDEALECDALFVVEL